MNIQYSLNLFILLNLSLFTSVYGQNEVDLGNTIITEREVAVGLDIPWEILWGPDNHIWLTERKGIVKRIDPNTGNTTIILDIQENVYTSLEPGLLGMALHPNFDTNPIVFLIYTYKESPVTELRLVSFIWNGTFLENEESFYTIRSGIFSGTNHVGSRILISEDEKLYVTVGDGGRSTNSQDSTKLFGKILRFNLDGSIPNDNPIPDSYIFSYGHRNPQGLAFGPMNQLYSTEHGDLESDEFNLIEAGKNYGWPEVEGFCDTENEVDFCSSMEIVEPIRSWTPCNAVNDLKYYTHDAIPEWKNKFLVSSLGGFSGGTPGISLLELNDNGTELIDENLYFDQYGRIRDICINPENGAIYFATNGDYFPGQGPNRIIEYKNLDFEYSSNIPIYETQNFEILPNLLVDKKECIVKCSEEFLNSKLYLFSYKGTLVKTFNLNSLITQISLSNLPKGSYFFKAITDFGSITKSIIVQ